MAMLVVILVQGTGKTEHPQMGRLPVVSLTDHVSVISDKWSLVRTLSRMWCSYGIFEVIAFREKK